MAEEKYHGHMTMADGSHVPLSAEQARDLWARAEEKTRRIAEEMPTPFDALGRICDGRERLRQLGWSDGIYCPKDGTQFAVIEWGSTGVFEAFYSGAWPDGHVIYEDCVGNPSGMMWKPLSALSDDERQAMARSAESTRQFIERLSWTAELVEDTPTRRDT